MRVDYTDLNKACPRDAYPLPNIDRLFYGAASNKVLSFLEMPPVTIKFPLPHLT